IDAFEAASSSENVVGTSWKQIMETAAADRNTERHVFGKRPLLNPLSLVAMRLVRLAARVFFRLRWAGLEKIPRGRPFLLCPNHESFLDGPLLISLLPKQVIYNLFILGYSDY